THIGYEAAELTIIHPSPEPIKVGLEEAEEEEAAVVVTATRTSRTIAHTPTRTEVISGEELAEKGNMKPGDIRMLLSESTGIQVQQTSATSYNAGIRIQGLDGRYTQILKDGYPLYAGFSGGLSILQVAPLDLRQVEVIKGSSSTLYGGGAIAGLVNLVSKTPGVKRELNFLVNGTSAGGLDISGYYSKRNQKAGITLYGSRNSTAAYDPADIGLTAIPRSERYTINPRLFLYGSRTTLDLGLSYISEDRTGGNTRYIRKETPTGYYESNVSNRLTSLLGIAHKIGTEATLQFKNSYTRFNRAIEVPGYRFDALQQSSFSELTYHTASRNIQWVTGLNLLTDDLAESRIAGNPQRDYHFNTYALFVQQAWNLTDRLTLETGLRTDYVKSYGWEWLPRLSALVRLSTHWTTRIGGGYGYKTPTVFTEESERIQFQNVQPIDPQRTQNERSKGGNWDVNYSNRFGRLGFSFNQLLFYTRLNHPLVLTGAPGGKLIFINSDGHLDTKGLETNLKLLYGAFKLFIGYTYTDANTHYTSEKEWLPLTARHRLNNILMYEKEERWKLGLEAYYFSKQRLTDGTNGQAYWITGFMAERSWKKISLFVNFENFTDTRQSKFGPLYSGSIDQPVFRDIYAPVEGFVVNGGLKLRL
ncbi:MAG TPA: TonB-dependent receptor, partial [Flavisolibacter sp.]|nr:TonB-dependent receptor [Flavisolibacter sp.]